MCCTWHHHSTGCRHMIRKSPVCCIRIISTHILPACHKADESENWQLTVFTTMLIFAKCESTSQELVPNRACGAPQLFGSGTWSMMSCGISPLAKCQIWMASDVHCRAYTPPPTPLKSSP